MPALGSLLFASLSALVACGGSSGGETDPPGGGSSGVGGNVPYTPPNGVQNSDETDVDCGGRSAAPCADGKLCKLGSDCASKVCGADGRCAPASTSDGVHNGAETDVDCGGPDALACAVGQRCDGGGDCLEKVCQGGLCAAPSHSDGVQNGDETGVDCGGAGAAPRCTEGSGCSSSADCGQGVCLEQTHTCAPASAVDGVHNGDETDVDCGGPVAAPCEPGKRCAQGADCGSKVCAADGRCAAPSPTDGVHNGDESDVDCGGSVAPNRCADGAACVAASDCASGVCGPQQACLPGSHNDGVRNAGETDVDCGGPSAPNRCAVGAGCAAAGDCVEGVCGGDQKCAAPSTSDGIKNGVETDVDCGGGSGKKCAANKRCAAHADCASDGCDDRGLCAHARSCIAEFGGRTCGAGEASLGNAEHESCCLTLPVPAANNVKLDKYNITAGRMRAFFTRTDGDVRGWIEAHRPAWWPAAWDEYLPTGMMTPVKMVDDVARNYGAYGQVGPNFLFNQDGEFGCFQGPTATGAPTYWMPNDVRQQMSAVDGGNRYSQEQLDMKALNCVTGILLAAFCAWDGGRLPTIAELDAAWGPAKFPWGNAPEPAGYYPAYPMPANVMRHSDSMWIHEGIRNGDVWRANYVKSYPQTIALWNALGGLQGNDLSFHIAPPGRYPLGAGPNGHMDLAGSMFGATSTYSGNVGDPRVGLMRWSRAGSWETAHRIPYGTHSSPILRKYWAMGGRCVKN